MRLLARVRPVELLYRWWIYWSWRPDGSGSARTAGPAAPSAGLFAKAIRDGVVSDRLPAEAVAARLSDRLQAGPHLERLVPDADSPERGGGRLSRWTTSRPTPCVTSDGVRHPADVLVFATGFATTQFLAHIPIQGIGGRRLADEWRGRCPRLSRHDGRRLPQLLSALRPQYQPRPQLDPLHGRAAGEPRPAGARPAGCRPGAKLGTAQRRASTRPPTGPTTNATQRRLAGTAWVAGCRSWYKDASGRVVNNWPTWTVRYWYDTLRLRRNDVSLLHGGDDTRLGLRYRAGRRPRPRRHRLLRPRQRRR